MNTKQDEQLTALVMGRRVGAGFSVGPITVTLLSTSRNSARVRIQAPKDWGIERIDATVQINKEAENEAATEEPTKAAK